MNNNQMQNQPPEDQLPDQLPQFIVEESAPRSYMIAGIVAALLLVTACVAGVVIISNSNVATRPQPTPPPLSNARVAVLGNVEPNAPVALRGTGFQPNEQVVVYVTESPNAPFSTFTSVVTVTAGSDGGFTVTGVNLPPSNTGTWYITARGSQSGFTAASPISSAPPTAAPSTSTPQPPPPTVGPTPTVGASATPQPPTATPTPPPPTPAPTPTNRPTATSTGTPDPGAVGIWYGRYYDNRDLIEPPVFVRYDKVLKFNWGSNSPGGGIPPGNFSVTWTRNEDIASANSYLFTLNVAGGVRMYVDGQLIISDWRNGALRTLTGSKYLSRGIHQYRVDYFNGGGPASIYVDWKVSYIGWTGRYYNTPNLDGPVVLIRDDADIAFDWGYGSPAPEVNPDYFSVAWTRSLNFPLSAMYIFTAVVDDGVRIYIDRSASPILDNFASAGSSVITGSTYLNAGTHMMEIQYNEKTGYAKIFVTWAPVLVGPTPTPSPTLSPTPTDTPTPPPMPTVVLLTDTPTPPPMPTVVLLTDTPTPVPTDTPTPTETPTETPTPVPTDALP